jgi:hypothetical protein
MNPIGPEQIISRNHADTVDVVTEDLIVGHIQSLQIYEYRSLPRGCYVS